MLFKKHDTKDFHALFLALIALLTIVVPYFGARLTKRIENEPYFILGIGIIASLLVYGKSKVDLFSYKNAFNPYSPYKTQKSLNKFTLSCYYITR